MVGVVYYAKIGTLTFVKEKCRFSIKQARQRLAPKALTEATAVVIAEGIITLKISILKTGLDIITLFRKFYKKFFSLFFFAGGTEEVSNANY